jgi:hypothetical protein
LPGDHRQAKYIIRLARGKRGSAEKKTVPVMRPAPPSHT